MLMYEIATLHPPFPEETDLCKLSKLIQEGSRPKIPRNIPEIYKIVMKKCWAHDPSKRPSITQVQRILDESYRKFGDVTTNSDSDPGGSSNSPVNDDNNNTSLSFPTNSSVNDDNNNTSLPSPTNSPVNDDNDNTSLLSPTRSSTRISQVPTNDVPTIEVIHVQNDQNSYQTDIDCSDVSSNSTFVSGSDNNSTGVVPGLSMARNYHNKCHYIEAFAIYKKFAEKENAIGEAWAGLYLCNNNFSI